MLELLVGVSVLLALLWIPIFLNFFRAWRERKNPVSLAICGIIAYAVYNNAVSVGLYAFGGSPKWSTVGIIVFEGITCVNFYFAFRWSQRKFHSDRQTPPNQS